jgi:hypothetical protein
MAQHPGQALAGMDAASTDTGTNEKTRVIMAETAYCVKCRDKREIKDTQSITMKNGKPAMQGLCTICGTKTTRILPTKVKVPVEA